MNDSAPRPGLLFAFPFRIFFLSAGVLAALLIPAWLTMLWQPGHWPVAVLPVAWHQHEMVVGFLNAAIAGFLLTAVCNWTGTPPVAGRRLLALWLLWLAGRLAMALGEPVPALAAAVDLAFLPAVAAIVAGRVWRARQPRQIPIVGILLLLWGMDLAFHLTGDMTFNRVMVLLAAALILVVGGRITPAFSRNGLRMTTGRPDVVQSFALLDYGTLVTALALVAAEVAGLTGPWMAIVAITAALFAGARLAFWRGWTVRGEPLLWILHLGMLWVVAGFLFRGLAALDLVAATVWIHALGPGAMGTMIIGVMTRVGLGHTGRPLELPPGVVSCYWLVLIAGLVRVLAGLELIGWHLGLWLSAVCWALAFLRFVYSYWPILAGPRADGRPG